MEILKSLMPRITESLLVDGYHEYGRPRSEWLVGAEFERLFLRGDGSQVAYFGKAGVGELLRVLSSAKHWEPNYEGENIIGLTGDNRAVTLEPGAQVEFAGVPHLSLCDLADEALDNLAEFQKASPSENLWVALGVTPFEQIEEIGWVPKGRYQVMRNYLPQRGPMAPVMMKGTTSFQACFDFEDEEDCSRKFDLMLRLSPLTTAMFANSPIFEGEITGWMSNRGRAWQATDAARTGFPSQIRDGYSHQRWVNYLLDVPMMFYVVDGEWRHAHGKSFRDFMLNGIDGHFPTIEAWDLHQTSVFPEVRVKKWIEIRGADACKMPLAIAAIAFWKGLLYSDTALEKALSLTSDLSNHPESDLIAASKDGLAATFGGTSALALARELFTIAEAGLAECDPSATHLLGPLELQLTKGECPAREVLRLYKSSANREQFLKMVSY